MLVGLFQNMRRHVSPCPRARGQVGLLLWPLLRRLVCPLGPLVCLILGLVTPMTVLMAQDALPPDEATAAPPWPAALSMPWRTPGIDPAELAEARPALEQSLNTLRPVWMTAPTSLTNYAEAAGRPLSINRRRLADRIITGRPTPMLTAPSIAVEPTWCSLMDRHVFFVTVADATRNALLAGAHTSIPRAEWSRLGAARGNWLSTRMAGLVQTALTQANARAGREASDALHVGLSLARHVSRRDEGSSHCVNLLIEERLAAEYTVVRALGADHLASVRDALGLEANLRRPTRGVVLTWTNAPEIQARRTLPATLNLQAAMSETVFGKALPLQHASDWTFAVANDGRINFAIDAGFKKLLDDERDTLRLDDWPQVARVYGAWVYLDRGRAWGLKMNDRVVAEVDGETVKGHVVRFFGPEQKLISPRGFPIREGAIVYIRKNQKRARIGMEFRMDPRTYPTPYPIPPGQ